ncbi:hypothetical protein BKD30_12740 [Tersicoccus phoenicis]|uniref:Lipoprotein n=1 Tax=Tersicoccus phoenicis TaxID=554083 RepID=A0A1R1L756_9MICC|nr:hypothetical protein [Tersicoccus phoenicis]OMH23380.1 hypothetical protein BKD30_12740 [Tersicoccus phoenicis]
MGKQRRRASVPVIAAVVAAALSGVLAGCTPGPPADTTASNSRSAAAVAPGRPGALPTSAGTESARADGGGVVYPLIAPTPPGEKVLVTASLRTGVGQVPFRDVPQGLVTMQAACRGTGSVQVALYAIRVMQVPCHRGAEPTFVAETIDVPPFETAAPAPTVNLHAFAVMVTARTDQQWAVTVSQRPAGPTASSSASPTSTSAPAR